MTETAISSVKRITKAIKKNQTKNDSMLDLFGDGIITKMS